MPIHFSTQYKLLTEKAHHKWSQLDTHFWAKFTKDFLIGTKDKKKEKKHNTAFSESDSSSFCEILLHLNKRK